MANVHYARIGDLWKHLPFAEVLSIERPGRYWESHAGSSTYPLTRSPERDYGVFLFLERAGRSSALEGSVYPRLLDPHQRGVPPQTYPGSPLIAMELLAPAGGSFVLCDLDGASLANIAQDARALGVPSDRVRLVQGDGVWTLDGGELAGLSEEEAAGTFLHVDPYRPLEPGRGGETPLGLYARAAQRGVGCMQWYGFDARSERAVVLEALREGIAGGAWYGEVSLRADDLSEVGFDPGVLGCGVVMCNVGQEALAACGRLGEGLAHAYSGARLPNGEDGALEFEEDTFLGAANVIHPSAWKMNSPKLRGLGLGGSDLYYTGPINPASWQVLVPFSSWPGRALMVRHSKRYRLPPMTVVSQHGWRSLQGWLACRHGRAAAPSLAPTNDTNAAAVPAATSVSARRRLIVPLASPRATTSRGCSS